MVYRDRAAPTEKRHVSSWTGATPCLDRCKTPWDHSGMVIDPPTIHTVTKFIAAANPNYDAVRTYMLWQPEGSAFLGRPDTVIGSLTFGQTFAVEKHFVEPRHAIDVLWEGGEKKCVCPLGSRPDLGEKEITSLGLRGVERMETAEERWDDEEEKAAANKKAKKAAKDRRERAERGRIEAESRMEGVEGNQDPGLALAGEGAQADMDI